MFGVAQRLEDHRQEDRREFNDLRTDLQRMHAENQASISRLVGRVDEHEQAARRASARMLIWIIGVLLTVIGSILLQSIHFKIALG
jgi:CHASE3 domain sensor protein